jgi:DNA-binding NarL/FixJ family response regulator
VLLGALRLVLSGGVYVPPLMLDAAEPAPGRAARPPLTPRQVEVLRLLARGLTNKEICGVLGIAEGTVKAHAVRIYEILNVTNRTEAATRLRELGLDEPG